MNTWWWYRPKAAIVACITLTFSSGLVSSLDFHGQTEHWSRTAGSNEWDCCTSVTGFPVSSWVYNLDTVWQGLTNIVSLFIDITCRITPWYGQRLGKLLCVLANCCRHYRFNYLPKKLIIIGNLRLKHSEKKGGMPVWLHIFLTDKNCSLRCKRWLSKSITKFSLVELDLLVPCKLQMFKGTYNLFKGTYKCFKPPKVSVNKFSRRWRVMRSTTV